MATRVDVQTGLDLIKFMNIINDFFDGSVKIIDGNLKNADGSELTFDQKKAGLAKAIGSIKGYKKIISDFIAANDKSATDGLAVFGIAKDDFVKEVNDLETHIQEFEAKLSQSPSELDSKLDEISSYKKSNIPSLSLVRNA
jgi:hypothetical protein